jgi:hypothetical protein
LYSIPLRSLTSRNVNNLLFAGRNISATHVAFASTRVQATCALMGQAIGTAVAVGLNSTVPADTVGQLAGAPYIGAIQQALLKDDAFLLGIPNRDPLDLARRAVITASDSVYPSANLSDGITRTLVPEWGAWSDNQSHQWRSTSLPAWIELRWPEPVPVGEVHLTFDSHFERILILTFSDSANEGVIRGPQPELVKDYRLIGDGELLLEVTDNCQRKRVHGLAPARSFRTLRIEVTSAHGVPEARIFEVRVY